MSNSDTNNTEQLNITDDDRYSEVYVDVEHGLKSSTLNANNIIHNIRHKDKEECENGSIESGVSMEKVYLDGKTHEHFIDKLSMELDHIKSKHRETNHNQEIDDSRRLSNNSLNSYSNSPLTMSVCSEHDTDYGENHTIDSKRAFFKKITYKEVEDSLNKLYTKDVQLSCELDILLTYLKGQRHIFNQSNRITIQKFNYLMFPAIFITGSITVLAPFLDTVGWSSWLLTVLNALLTIMITINNFMKWQAVAAIYLSISNQYDKLAISVEMSRNEYMFSDEEKKGILTLEKMKETEKQIMNIQYNYNDIIIPYEIQLMNPIISHINIFSFIKKIEHHKKSLIMKYKDVKNEIRYMMYRWEKETGYDILVNQRKQDDLDKMQKLFEKKEEIKNQMIQNNSNNVYAYIDNLFIREIRHSEKYYTYHSAGMYFIFRPKPLEPFTYGNAVVDDYLNFIFTKE
jgi:hypothetical protein